MIQFEDINNIMLIRPAIVIATCAKRQIIPRIIYIEVYSYSSNVLAIIVGTKEMTCRPVHGYKKCSVPCKGVLT